MTRIAVLADIHGNLPALNAVMDDMARFAVDHVVVAGDSVNWGPFSREVLEIITARKWAVIRGNNAYYALDYATSRAPERWSSFTLPTILREQLGETWLNVIACQPDTLSLRFADSPPVRVFHGIPDNPWISIHPLSTASEIDGWLKDVAEDTVICAHSHIPMERHIGRWHIFNPGSVGVPLDGERSASYMILQGDLHGWELEQHRRIQFDYASIYEEYERQRFPEKGGVTACLIQDEFRTARLQVHPFIVWKQKHFPDQRDSFELLERYRDLDDVSGYLPPEYLDLDSRLYRD